MNGRLTETVKENRSSIKGYKIGGIFFATNPD